MVKIDEEKCTGCGICANICPRGIEMVDGKARIKDENAECLKDAASSCPQNVIVFGDEENSGENINTNLKQNYNQSNWGGEESGQGRGMGVGKGRGLGGGPRDGRGRGRGGGRRRW